jgi:hypothetical protein
MEKNLYPSQYLYLAFQNLVEARRACGSMMKEWHQKLYLRDPLSFLKEWNTLRLGSCRRSGHNYVIYKACHYMFNKPLVIYYGLKSMKTVKECYDRSSTLHEGESEVRINANIAETFWQRDDTTQIPEGTDVVFVDCASFVSKNKIEKVYKCAVETKNPDLLIIMIE